MRLFVMGILLLLVAPFVIHGQQKGGVPAVSKTINDQTDFNINNIFLKLENDGTLSKTGFAYYPSSNNINFLFDGGPVITGIVNGVIRTAWNAESAQVSELQPGVWDQDPAESTARWYTVLNTDGFGSQAYIDWSEAINLGAQYQDLNNNGSYQPTIDRPDVWGDITAWTPYNDGTTIGQRNPLFQTLPIGLEIQQTSWAFNRSDLIGDIIFFRYRLINRNTVLADSLFFGIWSDPDLGDGSDDLVGCDPDDNFAFCYNDGDDAFYGSNPPAYGLKLIQGPITVTGNSSDSATIYRGPYAGTDTLVGAKNLGMSSFITYIGGDPLSGAPIDAQQARNYQLGGLTRGGQPIDPNQYGVINGGGSPDPKFFFSGDPVNNDGWLDDTPADRKMIINTGPFTMAQGDTQEIIFALVVSQGSDALSSIEQARLAADAALDLIPNFSPTAINPVDELPTTFALFNNYPNPFNPQTTFRFDLSTAAEVRLELFNLRGQQIATLLKDYRAAGEHRFRWDATGFPSGTYFARLSTEGHSIIRKVMLIK